MDTRDIFRAPQTWLQSCPYTATDRFLRGNESWVTAADFISQISSRGFDVATLGCIRITRVSFWTASTYTLTLVKRAISDVDTLGRLGSG